MLHSASSSSAFPPSLDQTAPPKQRDMAFDSGTATSCRVCGSRVRPENRVIHDVTCRRNAQRASPSRLTTPPSSYSHSVYTEYARAHGTSGRPLSDSVRRSRVQPLAVEVNPFPYSPYGEHAQVEQLRHFNQPPQMAGPLEQRYGHPHDTTRTLALSQSTYQLPSYSLPAYSASEASSPASTVAPFPVQLASFSLDGVDDGYDGGYDDGYDDGLRQLPSNRGDHALHEAILWHSDDRACQYCAQLIERAGHMTHELECAFTFVECDSCGYSIRRVDKQHHLNTECSAYRVRGREQAFEQEQAFGHSIDTDGFPGERGGDRYGSNWKQIAGAAAFTLAAYTASRMISRRRHANDSNLAQRQSGNDSSNGQ